MAKQHARPSRSTGGSASGGPTRRGGGGRGNAARADAMRHRVGDHTDMEKQGDWSDWFGEDSWMADFDWSVFNPLSWFAGPDEEDGPAPAPDGPVVDGPTPDGPTPDGPTPVGDDEVVQVLDAVQEAEETADPDLASRPTDVRTGLYGAVIAKDGGTIDLHESAAADSSVKLSVADGTPCRIVSVGDGFVEVALRKGDEEATGWVNQALFSDQPRLFKDDDNAALMEDYTWTHFSGDQSMPDSADGRTVQQGGLADCYFVAAMNAVGMANPAFLRESIVYDEKTGMYRCRFFEEAGWDHTLGRARTEEVWVEVDGYLPTQGTALDPAYADDNDSTVWGAIYEKAYAKWKGGYNVMGDGGYGSEAMEEMTGNPSSYRSTSQLSEEEVIPFFERAKADGLAIYTGSNSTGEVETQSPLTAQGDNTYAGTVNQSHRWNKLEPGTVRIEDLSGKVGVAHDTGSEGDKQADIRGLDVAEGEVVYKENTLSVRYHEGMSPEAADQLQVTAEFKGMIFPEKEVIGWHGYSFDKLVDGGLIQLYNPWGSYQPKPLTPAEYLKYYGSLSTAQVPQAQGEG